jgi:hypothetical protein
MAKTSGGVKKTGGMAPGDANYKGKIEGVRPLSSIKHPDVYREIKQGISRYHAVMGVRQKNVKLATLDSGMNGVHMTTGGISSGVYLSSKVYDMKKKDIIARTKNSYNSGWSTATNKPIQHTITHELAHATWNSHLTSKNAKAASREITLLHKHWSDDTKKKGYGEYSHTNINEFWAEVSTKAVHGTADKYTKKVKSIVKRYKL